MRLTWRRRRGLVSFIEGDTATMARTDRDNSEGLERCKAQGDTQLQGLVTIGMPYFLHALLRPSKSWWSWCNTS